MYKNFIDYPIVSISMNLIAKKLFSSKIDWSPDRAHDIGLLAGPLESACTTSACAREMKMK